MENLIIENCLVDELKLIVGNEFVLSSNKERELHSRSTETFKNICEVIVYPKSTQEVQKIIHLATLTKTPIWTFSRGNNWGYGTKNANHSGAIILILERMNRIIEVNEELAYVVLEPGVSQEQLQTYLQKNHPTLWMDCTDSTPNGSVLGNALERGYGYTPYGDHFQNLCGLDIVLPNGEMYPSDRDVVECATRYTHKWGSGPFLDGIFSQSNLGIAVRGGIWLMPKPEKYFVFTMDMTAQNLPEVINQYRQLMLEGTLESHVHTVNAFQTISVLQKFPQSIINQSGMLSVEEINELKNKYGIPDWSSIGAIYGTRGQVKAKKNDLKRRLKNLGDLNFFDEAKIEQSKMLVDTWNKSGGKGLFANFLLFIKSFVTKKHFSLVALLPEMAGVLRGEPTKAIIRSAYFKSQINPDLNHCDPAKDNCGLMWCAPAIPARAEDVKKILNVETNFTKFEFNMSACFTVMNARTFFVLLGVFFDKSKEAEMVRANALYKTLARQISGLGYQRYRSGVQDWKNSEGQESVAQKIKKALDPDNILSPGRYGVVASQSNEESPNLSA